MLALAFYKRLGHVADDHEAGVRELARRIGRSTGSVVRKLANFLAVETNRRKGLKHYASIDVSVYKEFEGRENDLNLEEERILEAYRVRHARIISVTERGRGRDAPRTMSQMTLRLLGSSEGYYRLTGDKKYLELISGEHLFFRFRGKLIGEAAFWRWDEDKPDTFHFRRARPFPNQVLARKYVRGRNPYPVVDRDTILQIRRDAEDLTGGTMAPIGTGEATSQAVHRRGQDRIRRAALIRYGNQCCLCQIDSAALLVAGHIRGWAEGEAARGEPENVVLMCSLHDDLFGKGFIGLDPHNYSVIYASRALSDLALREIRRITGRFRPPSHSPPARRYLRWHLRHVFRDTSKG